VYGALFAVVDLLKNPRYAAPLVLNLTGSVWFFLLIGKAGTLFYISLVMGSVLLCCVVCFGDGGGGDGGKGGGGVGWVRWLGRAAREGWFLRLIDTDGWVELSLTVPIVNTLAFLFTVVGEWWVEGKVISRGMSFFCVFEVRVWY